MSKSPSLARERIASGSPAYADDFYSWALHQAELVRGGRLAEADLPNIAEELADLGRSERRELRSALARIMQHLLKWDYQPAKRTVSWQKSIDIHRVHARQDLRDNPGLRAELGDILSDAYEMAVRYAAKETGVSRAAFPATCPYDFDSVMNRMVGGSEA